MSLMRSLLSVDRKLVMSSRAISVAFHVVTWCQMMTPDATSIRLVFRLVLTYLLTAIGLSVEVSPERKIFLNLVSRVVAR